MTTANQQIDQTIADIEETIRSVPRSAQVQQLYSDGDLGRIGLLTGDALESIGGKLADELNAEALVYEELAKIKRAEANELVADIIRRLANMRREIVEIGEIAKDSRQHLRDLRGKLLRKVEGDVKPGAAIWDGAQWREEDGTPISSQQGGGL